MRISTVGAGIVTVAVLSAVLVVLGPSSPVSVNAQTDSWTAEYPMLLTAARAMGLARSDYAIVFEVLAHLSGADR